MAESEEKPVGLKAKEERIASVNLPEIDCWMMDARTRKVMIYLIDGELKRNRTYPKEWVEGINEELTRIKKGLEMCTRIRARKEKNAEQGSSPPGSSAGPAQEAAGVRGEKQPVSEPEV
ncbi:MAG: hypothetical protein PHZ19_00475 [Candidatus Thermoplasmatota archaeon]|nr:hypothetical protein [Candidatus Thermoplasmatota archaeon]